LDERLQRIEACIEFEKWTASELLDEKFSRNVKCSPVSLIEITTVGVATEGPASSQPEQKEEPAKKKSRFSLGGLNQGADSQESAGKAIHESQFKKKERDLDFSHDGRIHIRSGKECKAKLIVDARNL
jgi:hypothetical protein